MEKQYIPNMVCLSSTIHNRLFIFLSISHLFKGSHNKHRPSRFFLLLVAAGFTFLSMDEAAVIHEKITNLLKDITRIPRFTGNHGIWIFVYFIGSLVFLIATIPQNFAMWKYHKRETLIMAVGIGLFLTGAVGLEIISYEFLRGQGQPVLLDVEAGLEEFLEMFGGSVILYGNFLFALRIKEAPF